MPFNKPKRMLAHKPFNYNTLPIGHDSSPPYKRFLKRKYNNFYFETSINLLIINDIRTFKTKLIISKSIKNMPKKYLIYEVEDDN